MELKNIKPITKVKDVKPINSYIRFTPNFAPGTQEVELWEDDYLWEDDETWGGKDLLINESNPTINIK